MGVKTGLDRGCETGIFFPRDVYIYESFFSMNTTNLIEMSMFEKEGKMGKYMFFVFICSDFCQIYHLFMIFRSFYIMHLSWFLGGNGYKLL